MIPIIDCGKGFKLTCTTEVAVATISGGLTGAAAGAAFGGVGAIPGAVIGANIGAATARGTEGKGPLKGLEQPKPAKPVKKPDLALQRRKEREREVRRQLQGRPGRGRGGTIFSDPTAAGRTQLKKKLGE